jgi:C-terminal processing protease CtpA/Prc
MGTVSGMAKAVVEEALRLLCEKYVFPDKATRSAELVRERLAAGDYDGLDETALGAALTAAFDQVCADKHLRVRPRKPGHEKAMTEEEFVAAWVEDLRLANHGIARVERLDGNIGYLDLRLVSSPDVGGGAIAAAMELVSRTEALIIDLRKNRGGSPQGVQFWNSYFFPDADTHLNDIYDGESGRTRQFWTLDYLPGGRYLDRPIWILTSAATFSGAEEFCYTLQALGRATLIGETTGGGAHPTMPFALTDTLEITIPLARSINPVTGTNWEGVGVRPDVQTTAEEAFDVAYRKALEHVVSTVTNQRVVDEANEALNR